MASRSRSCRTRLGSRQTSASQQRLGLGGVRSSSNLRIRIRSGNLVLLLPMQHELELPHTLRKGHGSLPIENTAQLSDHIQSRGHRRLNRRRSRCSPGGCNNAQIHFRKILLQRQALAACNRKAGLQLGNLALDALHSSPLCLQRPLETLGLPGERLRQASLPLIIQ